MYKDREDYFKSKSEKIIKFNEELKYKCILIIKLIE